VIAAPDTTGKTLALVATNADLATDFTRNHSTHRDFSLPNLGASQMLGIGFSHHAQLTDITSS